MIVKTIDKKEFSSICQELYAMIDQNNLTHLIFIENGGTYIFKELDGKISKNIIISTLRVFRPSTSVKEKKFVKYILKNLPLKIVNILRKIESKFFKKFGNSERSYIYNDKFIDQIKKIKKNKEMVIYIIDDAIDSGNTVQYIINYILNLNNNIKRDNIKIACISQTQSDSLIAPDVKIYENVLCRFHWSNDFR